MPSPGPRRPGLDFRHLLPGSPCRAGGGGAAAATALAKHSAAPGERARCGSAVLPRPPRPAEAQPCLRRLRLDSAAEDASEPGSRASGEPIPDARPRCHGRLHGLTATWPWLGAPGAQSRHPDSQSGRRDPWRQELPPRAPTRADFLAVLFAAHVGSSFPWLPGLTLAGHRGLSPPLGRHPKVGLPRPRPPHSRPSLAASLPRARHSFLRLSGAVLGVALLN